MDISSPNGLWRDYFVSALPLNTKKISSTIEDDITVDNYYFDGLITTDGRVRAFIKIYNPNDSKGIILYMPDAHNGVNKDDVVEFMIRRGYTVAILDYTGKSNSIANYTIYPKSLDACNCKHQSQFIVANEAVNSRWYVWTCIARRATTLLKELFPDQKIYGLGKELGGCTIYKLASFDDGLTACTTLLNILPDVTGEGNTEINYRTALSNFAYSQISKLPIFMAVCSNTKDGTLDKMSELVESTSSLKGFRIIKRAAADGIKIVYDQIDNFFQSFDSDAYSYVDKIDITPTNSDNNLYFNIKTTSDIENNYTIELYGAFCIENSANRNWTKLKISHIGDGEFISRVDVLQSDKPVYVFINLIDENGYVYSSPITTIIPKNLGITAVPAIRRRLIYDGSMGTDTWTTTGSDSISLKSGPFDIMGVTSENNTLITYKSGDMLYRAEHGALLQLLVSGACKNLTITVSDGTDEYVCLTEISSPDEWNKLTLSPNDFKSSNGPLEEWESVVMIKFSGDDELIISSALWV